MKSLNGYLIANELMVVRNKYRDRGTYCAVTES